MTSSALSLSILILSSAWSSLFLNPSIKVFSSVMVFFSSYDFCLELFNISFVEIVMLFLCWSPHFGEHLCDHYCQLSTLSITSFHFIRSISVDLFCFFFVWNIFTYFFIFLGSLCRFLCIRQNSCLFQSYKLVLCRRWTLSISLAQVSGCLSNLYNYSGHYIYSEWLPGIEAVPRLIIVSKGRTSVRI